ncbi:MAG: DUF2461 domain-containing protein [Candidatus Lernaella stagnicola]|nr:DUF2461 domain-containing protein [Candidatus Lernaella stagnicola]
MSGDAFQGFTKQTASFFRGLKKNNDKAWFTAHREQYDEHALEPARAFVVALGDKLRTIAPGVVADPRVNKSLFRIHRDTRFSHDKSPYKTHMGLWLWEGPHRGRMENSGFYFHLEPPNIMLGIGLYRFTDTALKNYRIDGAHPVHGRALRDAVDKLTKKGFAIGGLHYKRVPRSVDPTHPNAELLRHNGLYVGVEMKIPDAFYTTKLPAFSLRLYKQMLPLHQWLLAFTERNL